MNGDIKIGKLLCDEDIITRRQLNQALQVQVKGDKRSLGEILVAKGFCSLDDITEVIMQSDSKNGHEKHQEVIAEKIEPKEEPQEEVKELSEDTKFSMSVGTMIGVGTAIASVVGVYYMLIGEIEEAKELPSLETLYSAEYPSRPEGYNWPRSYEQYKDQVGSLQDDMDDVFEQVEELEDIIKELIKDIKDLEKRKRDK
jgi:tetrahydromethanopterin S-methyltransferase subunit B